MTVPCTAHMWCVWLCLLFFQYTLIFIMLLLFLVISFRFKCAYHVSDYSIISRSLGIISPGCCSCFPSPVEFHFLSVCLFIFTPLYSVWWDNPFRAVSLWFLPEAREVPESQCGTGVNFSVRAPAPQEWCKLRARTCSMPTWVSRSLQIASADPLQACPGG